MTIDDVIKISEFLNAPTILFMGWMFWKMKNHFDEKLDQRFHHSHQILDKRFDKIDQRFDKIDQRFDKIENEILETRKGVNRLEGTVYGVQSFKLDEDYRHEKRRHR